MVQKFVGNFCAKRNPASSGDGNHYCKVASTRNDKDSNGVQSHEVGFHSDGVD